MIVIDVLMLYWEWLVVAVAVLLLMSVTAIYFRRFRRRLRLYESELEEARNLLESRVQERTAALEEEINQRKQSEELVLSSERKFHSIFENANDAVLLIKEGTFVDGNPKALEVFKGKRDEIIGRRISEFSPAKQPDGRNSEKAVLEKIDAALAGTPQFFDWKYKRLDGILFDAEVSLNRIQIENEPVVLAVVRDITERQKVQAELQKQEERYHSLYDTIAEGLCLQEIIYNKSGKAVDYRILDINPAYEKITGISRERAINSRASDLYGTGELPYLDIYAKVAETGEPHSFETYFPLMDKYFNISVSSPKKDHFATVFSDITERKKMERQIIQAELQEQEERYHSLYNTITEGLCLQEIIYDKSGKAVDYRILDINSSYEKITGINREKAINSKASDLYGTGEPPYLDIYAKVAETGEPHSFETYFPPMDKYFNISVSSPKKDQFATVFSDITERKKLEQQLIVTDRLASIGELASGIAHEINNPMTGIIGLSELLLDADVSEEVKNDLKMINSEAQRISQIVRNLLTFARRHKPERQSININDVIQSVLQLRAYEHKVNDITVDTGFAPDLPKISANGFQLQQVFLNIIINAEHFMIEAHGRGALKITTEQTDDVVRVSFTDDGPGIPRENLTRIFDPFFTTREVGKGTGLGLSISYGIIAEHDGRIYAESEVGRGTTFVVELPVNKVGTEG